MKKGDVGMAKHFSKKYGNKGWALDYPVSAIWNQFLFCQDACQCHTSPHTHAAWKVLHLLYRKDITYTLQPHFCNVD